MFYNLLAGFFTLRAMKLSKSTFSPDQVTLYHNIVAFLRNTLKQIADIMVSLGWSQEEEEKQV